MADFVDWRVRKGPAPRRFSDGLVVQGARRGFLDLSASRLARGHASLEALGFLRPLAAACASEGIRRDTGIISWLYWPDLVTIDGRVVAKSTLSLAPSDGQGGSTQVTMALSVNCSSKKPEPFPSVQLQSTSILEALGVGVDLDLLRDKTLHALNWYYAEWERGMNLKLAARIRPTIVWLGRDVEVRIAGGRVLRGNAKGLDDQGSLLLERREGRGRGRTTAIRPDNVEFVKAVG